jgi:SMC interacting uncharacterized protein involved in chromosome segregation
LLLLGAIGASWWYVRTTRQAEAEQQQAAERQRQQQILQARIGGLRERIAELSKRTSQAADTQAAREASRRLRELTEQLDAIKQFPPEKYLEAHQACDEIEKSFRGLKSEVENLSGLPRQHRTAQEPVRC